MMRFIGLTGGIASGKSTVSALLKKQGAFIIDADQIAYNVVEQGEQAYKDIVTAFGGDVVLADGRLNRQKLGALVFQDAKKRALLEKFTHPRIEERIVELIEFAQKNSYPVIILDMPLLFETGWDKRVDEVWVIQVDESIQRQRLMKRNSFSEQEATLRMKAQKSQVEKIRKADQVIDNNGDLAKLQAEILRVWAQVMQ
ncbi:dephospho-CoA kinase [Sporomusaceae bacterium BoRhaA]|uniref:dephospho-CoA kinase n=1 Tax=Pelorhabdus rhamnosifermentans TaxID=2772457 RepID=UPI001C06072E|nr:dephospho-CoA kinase [Pelorhabdus rhamnosifermentans]MBU2702463.1 dephospho-CoA kinase [Pelorhabdus rhamnosifermentans]